MAEAVTTVPPTATSSSFQRAALWASPAGLVGLLKIGPFVDTGVTTCPFAIVTDVACPLCGGTRAAAAILRGDWETAWALHPLTFAIVPLLAFLWVRIVRGAQPVSPSAANRLWLALGVVAMALWFVRMAAGHLPPV